MQETERTREAVQVRMHAYEQVLRGGIGLFNASEHVSRQTWHDYVSSLNINENFPGIQGIGFSQYILPDELQRHIERIRSEGFPEYTVKPAGKRPEYTSIIYLEPFDARNQRAFGFDMLSEATRHAAMARARDTGHTAVSGKVILKQETSKDIQSGFLMYLPLYRKGVNLDSVEQRQNALLGYVYSPFRMTNLMRGILGQEEKSFDIDLEIYDGTEISDNTLMYDHDGIMYGNNANHVRLFSHVVKLEIEWQDWTLVITSTPTFEAAIDHSKSTIVALAGILISLLFSAVVWSLGTQRSRAQELALRMTASLRKQEALTHAIVDDAADGIITIDDAGCIQSFNRMAELIFGYALDEVKEKNVNLLMPEPYHSAHDGYLVNYLSTGSKKLIGIGREVVGLRKNGETFPMDLAVSEVQQSDQTRLFVGIVRDISQRKKIEEDLRRSEERFDLAMRGANDGLWDLDMKTDRVYYSPRWKSMLGFSQDEISDSSEEWRKRIHPDDLDRVMGEVNAYMAGNAEHFRSEHRLHCKDGHYLWILSRAIVQCDADGKPHRMVGIQTDISKRKQMDSLKSEFVSTVSHELRTPLTSIRGSLGLVSGGVAGELPAQAKSLIAIAYGNTERLLALINDLLDIDKIQSGKMDFHLKPQALMPLIEQAITANGGYAEQYQMSYRITSSLPEVMVNADSERLVQVMSNLLSNAAKFSHPGDQVEIATTLENQRVRIAVTDHGVGIPEAFHERIFEKFTQADSSDTRHKGGTGLGLSITKAIVEMMHGEIGFSSKQGVGTTFWFILPEYTETTSTSDR
ncbi:MAG: CHASE domain-containing protein [Sulfurimicrobium sp.]|nr:CHASE domain-containing protein [Sulfurimicrobium sp.]MDP1896559.1 CHASE domain-containing protein [Sulfurimicrobium sp.]MDP2197988.1 CHASE domain-containing protein [Sulfurimicrobium sp.]MDP2962983.1 CHASE domain-containing protein [Sulfurimicrobium sp.]MDP3688542.1 CHASE domain-containing protein [Sulfurimicrobium sp.]